MDGSRGQVVARIRINSALKQNIGPGVKPGGLAGLLVLPGKDHGWAIVLVLRSNQYKNSIVQYMVYFYARCRIFP
jgi:hypothetical protein